MLLVLYVYRRANRIMEKQTTQISTWNKMVHATFKKVITFDLICIGIGIMIGIGIGAYLVVGT